MTKKQLSLFLILAVCILLITAGCGNKNNTNNTPSTGTGNNTNTGTGNTGNTGNNAATTTATAESVYKAQCVGCHAADLSGSVGPNLQKAGSKLTAEQISTQINNGGGGMPAYKGTLSAEEITALTDWLAAKK